MTSLDLDVRENRQMSSLYMPYGRFLYYTTVDVASGTRYKAASLSDLRRYVDMP